MSYIVNYRQGPPLRRRTLFAVLAGMYTAAMLLSFVGASRFVSPDFLVWVFCAAWFGPMVAAIPFLTQTRTRWGWITVVMLFGLFIAIMPPFLGPPSLLTARGEPLRATVIGAEAPVEGEGELHYSLQTTGGIPIPGVLKAHDGYTVGSRVNVVVDPDGLVHPRLADDVRGWTWWLGPAVLAPFYGLQLLFCWLGAKPRRNPLDVETTPWLQPGRSGRAVLEGMPWWLLGFGAFLMVLSLFLMVPAWQVRELNHNGVAGTVDPRECTPHYDRLGYETSWTCAGPFTSDDGKLRIERVVIEPDPQQRPDAPVIAKVAGAGSAVASTDSAWLADFLVGLGIFAIGVGTAAVGAITFLASITGRRTRRAALLRN